MNKKIFISTGEVSGDLHGSLLSKALLDEAKKKSIDLEICGLGAVSYTHLTLPTILRV